MSEPKPTNTALQGVPHRRGAIKSKDMLRDVCGLLVEAAAGLRRRGKRFAVPQVIRRIANGEEELE